MDFPYESTFLRSALASDPYSLGDVGPEDILRIESQFPYLFDSPRAYRQGGDAKPTAARRKVVGSNAAFKTKPTRSADSFLKPPTTKSTGSNSWKQNHLPPNMFCFSRDELKFMLEDVIRNSNNKVGSYTTPNAGTRTNSTSNLGRSNSTSNVGRSNSIPNLGRSTSNYNGPQNLANLIAEREKRLSQKLLDIIDEPHIQKAFAEPRHNPSRTKLNKPSSFLAPGFLRIPHRSSSHRFKPASSEKKKSVTFAKQPKKSQENITENVKAPQECDQSSETVEDISVRGVENLVEIEDFYSDSESISMDQIHLKGPMKSQMSQNIHEKVKMPLDSPESKSLELKLATSLADKYEKVGLLKKRSTCIENESIKEKKPVQLCEKSTSTSPPKKIKSKTSPTRKAFLEDLARELVYSEVLKHLETIRTEQREDSETSTSTVQSDKSIQATNISQPLDETFVVHTPELSSESSIKITQVDDNHPQDIPEKLSPPTPVTPILSNTFTGAGASSGKKTPKKSPLENDVTDCSEISDFLASEVEYKQQSILENEDDDHESFPSFATPNLTSTPRNHSVASKTPKSREDSKKSTTNFVDVVTPEKSPVSSARNISNISSVKDSKEKSKEEEIELPSISLTNTSPSNKTSSIRSKQQATSDKVPKVSFDIPREISFSECISEREVLWDEARFNDSCKYRSPGEVSLSQCLSMEVNSPSRTTSFSGSPSEVTSSSKNASPGEISSGEVL